MACTSDVLAKAGMLALFAAIRLRMWREEKLSVIMEHVALRLDNLRLFNAPVSIDPELVEEVCSVVSAVEEKYGFRPWFLSSLLELLECAGVECGSVPSEGVKDRQVVEN